MRSMANTTLVFGLVSVPVKLYKATDDPEYVFRSVAEDGTRLRQQYVREDTGEVVDFRDQRKGFETDEGILVFERAEIKALEESSTDLEIEAFVPLDEVPRGRVRGSYYLAPSKTGGARAYALVLQSLQALGVAGVGTWRNRGRDHVIVVRSEGGKLVMETMVFRAQVREMEVEALPEVSPKEVELANSLVRSMLTGGAVLDQYEDAYQGRVAAMVEAKMGGEVVVPPSVVERKATEEDVLLAALEASLSRSLV